MDGARRPDVYILSDSLGETAEQVSRAALAQFPEDAFHVVRLPRVTSRGQLEGVIKGASGERVVFVYTLAEPRLREAMETLIAERGLGAVDVLGPTVGALAGATGSEPNWRPGAIRQTDKEYFDRVEALDFAVQHDDGRNAEHLPAADIVLIGVSRSSKTPLSMYLAFKGYRVANIPLVPDVAPPAELYEVDARRVFGLLIDPDLLVEIRRARLIEIGSAAGHYGEREAIELELEESRALMRRLGCIIVHVGTRAIEETAQEILRHYAEALGVDGEEPVPRRRESVAGASARRPSRRPLRRQGD